MVLWTLEDSEFVAFEVEEGGLEVASELPEQSMFELELHSLTHQSAVKLRDAVCLEHDASVPTGPAFVMDSLRKC